MSAFVPAVDTRGPGRQLRRRLRRRRVRTWCWRRANTAVTSKPKARHIRAELIVRRVKDMNATNESELFTAYRHHAVFTNSPLPVLEAGKAHRAHAIVEQVIADLKNGPLAHPAISTGPQSPGSKSTTAA